MTNKEKLIFGFSIPKDIKWRYNLNPRDCVDVWSWMFLEKVFVKDLGFIQIGSYLKVKTLLKADRLIIQKDRVGDYNIWISLSENYIPKNNEILEKLKKDKE